jgi:3-deoxy-manno-octulosonate cytidylyltransferase (CMP-KDO synthetase)
MYRSTILIPARLGSTRFPAKLIAQLGEETVLRHTVKNCLKVKDARVVVLTEDQEIMDHVSDLCEAHITPPATNGTRRICSFLDRIETDIVLNVQGDEPFVHPRDLERMITVMEEVHFKDQIYTLDQWMTDKELLNRNHVKLYKSPWIEVAFFTRSPIYRQIQGLYKHIGIYGFYMEALKKIKDLKITTNSEAESLEQITWMDNGIRINSLTTVNRYISIDTPEDLKKAINRIKNG